MTYTSDSLADTERIAREFVEFLVAREGESRATVVGLYGDLGAGKTSFTQCVARVFGVSETVASPTFVIEKIYELPVPQDIDVEKSTENGSKQKFRHLIHIDAYRLDHSSELVNLGWDNIISDPHNLILIEWPERVQGIMPEHHIRIIFTHVSENVRGLEII